MWTIIAVGKIKSSPEKNLCADYIKQCKYPINIIEVEEKKNLSRVERKNKEAELILNKIPNNSYIFALDERGKNITSQEFAKKIENLQRMSYKNIVFIIGGAYGLDEKLYSKANFVLSFGQMTMAHMLVRVVLTEQIYRVQQILSNHPYHK